MTAKPESKLWAKLKEGTKDLGVFWTRLESWASPGVPDVHGIKEGVSFWLELKVHRLKSLKNIKLSPHQIAWQIRYIGKNGIVKNLVEHPSSATINIFCGKRAMNLRECPITKGELTPDWSSRSPYDWHGLLNHILSSSTSHHNEERIIKDQKRS